MKILNTATSPEPARSYSRSSAAALLLPVCLLSSAPLAFGQAPGAPETDARLDTVIVTSQRREQSLQDVPIAVTAIDSAYVESRGIVSIDGLSTLAPSLKIEQTPGNTTAAQISIRGGVTINPALTWEPTVGLYLDGVYIGKTQGSVFDVADIERIEVLRGPQGTLYGRNTLAGAINIVSRKPSGRFGGYAEAGIGNYNQRQARGSVDFDQIGPFKIRLSGMLRQRDGIIDVNENPIPGVLAAGPRSTSELDTIDRVSGLLAVQFDLTDTITVDYAFDYSKADQLPKFSQIIAVDAGNIFDPASPAYIGGGAADGQYFGFPLDLFTNRPRQFSASVDGDVFEKSRVSGHTLTATFDLGGTEIKSISGYRELEWEDALDLDGSPLPLAHTQRLSDYESFSQEFQLTGAFDKLDYVAGIYYFKDEGITNNPQFFFGGGARFDSRYGFDTEALAGYGQLDWGVTDRITLTGGLRYTREEKSISRQLTLLGPPDIALIPAGTRAKETFDGVSPTFVIAYALTDDVNFYAKYAEGYKSGGFNGEASDVEETIRPYDAETVASYELGLKTVWANGRLRINAAAFQNEHTDMQLSVFTAENAAASNVRNAGKATIRGLEIEAKALISDTISLGANYARLDTNYDEFIDGGINVANNRSFPHAPEQTFSIVADGRLFEGSIGRFDVNADYQYSDAYFTFPFTLDRNAPQNAFNSQASSRGIVNARLAWSRQLESGKGLQASIWARNLLDKEYITNFIDFGPGFGGLVNGYFADPQTYGLSLRLDW